MSEQQPSYAVERGHAPMVVAAARAMCKRGAELCNVDFEDSWKLYGGDYLADAQAALDAAGAPELLDELQKAHRLLQLALKHMSGERQSLFAADSEREGLGTDGATRHHERAEVIKAAGGAA